MKYLKIISFFFFLVIFGPIGQKGRLDFFLFGLICKFFGEGGQVYKFSDHI